MGGIFQNSWRGAAAEADAAAVEAVAIGEQQTKRTTSGGRVEADAIGEQQLKRIDAIGEQLAIESSMQLKRTQAASSN